MTPLAGVLVPQWPAAPRVRAVTTLRTPGPPETLEALEARIAATLPLPERPAWLRQVHGTRVVDLDLLPADAPRPEADAAITRRAGCVCAIQTADCLPVLFAAHAAPVVGAAHAGWRGLVAGVLESTVRAMDAAPSTITAWLGPAIGPAHFEVGEEVRAAFLAADAAADLAFTPNARGRWQCDLYLLARQRLAAVGVTDVHGGGLCTFSDPVRFHSWRREGGTSARLATLIWLEPPP